MAQLQERLQAATRSAQELAEAHAGKLKAAEARNHELAARLEDAEQKSQARITELTLLLQQATEELQRQHELAEMTAVPPEPEVADTAQVRSKPPTMVALEGSETKEAAIAEPAISPEEMPGQAVPVETDAAEDPPVTPTQKSPAPAAETDTDEVGVGEVGNGSEPPEVKAAAVSEMPTSGSETEYPKTEAEAQSAPAPEPSEGPSSATPEARETKRKSGKSKKQPRREPQMDLFGEHQSPEPAETVEEPVMDTPPLLMVESEGPTAEEERPAEVESATKANGDDAPAKEHKPVRRLPPPPPVDPAELRKAVNEILPLFIEQDPGAKDCFKANRNTFRSAFVPELYLEFEQCVKKGEYSNALEHLRKAVRKHGITV